MGVGWGIFSKISLIDNSDISLLVFYHYKMKLEGMLKNVKTGILQPIQKKENKEKLE